MSNPFDPILETLTEISQKLTLLEFVKNSPLREIELIDTKELMKRCDISEPTVIRLRKKGKIPYVQIGHVVRFDWYKVVEALEKR